jgi:hypothetical protein
MIQIVKIKKIVESCLEYVLNYQGKGRSYKEPFPSLRLF